MARERETKKRDSVFDFLYVDQRRVGLYISQFSEFGNLTNLVHARSVSDDTGIAGGLPGVATGEAKQSQQVGIERHYSTQWSEVLNFLDEVQARQMLRKNIESAPIGGLFLASGSLYLVDMRSFSRTWDVVADLPARSAPVGSRRERRSAGRYRPPQGDDLSGLRVLGSLNQPVFMVLRSNDNRLWSTLDPDCLTGGGSDVNLKQGVHISGEWHVLGILDCQPGLGNVDSADIGRLCGGGDNIFSEGVVRIWEELRLVLGRPEDCYGVTPLVIMREVT